MYEAGHPRLMLWDNSEGWGGEGGEREFQDGGTHAYPWLNFCIVQELNR